MNNGMKHTLRPASPDDLEMLIRINREGYKEYVESIWGWDENFQREYLRTHVRYENIRLIVIGETVVGFVSWREGADAFFLESLVLLPEFRSRGIGTDILLGLTSAARERGVCLELQVFKANRDAQRLYDRLGFRRCGENENHYKYRME